MGILTSHVNLWIIEAGGCHNNQPLPHENPIQHQSSAGPPIEKQHRWGFSGDEVDFFSTFNDLGSHMDYCSYLVTDYGFKFQAWSVAHFWVMILRYQKRSKRWVHVSFPAGKMFQMFYDSIKSAWVPPFYIFFPVFGGLYLYLNVNLESVSIWEFPENGGTQNGWFISGKIPYRNRWFGGTLSWLRKPPYIIPISNRDFQSIPIYQSLFFMSFPWFSHIYIYMETPMNIPINHILTL